MAEKENKTLKTITVLGIDPGIQNTGLAIVMGNTQYKLIDSVHVKTKSSEDTSDRLHQIYTQGNELLTRHAVDAICIEKVYHNKNVNSSISTGMVIGVIHIMAKMHKKPVIELTPQAIKKATGLGAKATKAEIMKVGTQMFGIDMESDHQADAIFAAVAGILHLRTPKEQRGE